MDDVKRYEMLWPTLLMQAAQAVAKSKGLSLAAYIRMCVAERAEVQAKMGE